MSFVDLRCRAAHGDPPITTPGILPDASREITHGRAPGSIHAGPRVSASSRDSDTRPIVFGFHDSPPFIVRLASRSRRPLGRGDDLLGRVGQAVGRDDLAAAFLDELLAQLDVGPLEPDDQGDAEIELVVGRQQGRRRSCRTS